MRFWTAYKSDGDGKYIYRSSWSIKTPVALMGKVNKASSIENVVMVDPTDEEINSTHNAVVLPLTDRVVVAMSFKAMDAPLNFDMRNSVYPSYRRERWQEKYQDHCFVIVDGQRKEVCAGCPNILARAAGKCDRLTRGCDRKFAEVYKDKPIVLPAGSLYVPAHECTSIQAFATYTVDNLNVDHAVGGSSVNIQRPNSITTKGVSSTHFRRICCGACHFSEEPVINKKNKLKHCKAGIRSTWCPGPFFEYDIPVASTYDAALLIEYRWALRVMNTTLRDEEVLAALKQVYGNDYELRKYKHPDYSIGIAYDGTSGYFGKRYRSGEVVHLAANPCSLGIVAPGISNKRMSSITSPQDWEKLYPHLEQLLPRKPKTVDEAYDLYGPVDLTERMLLVAMSKNYMPLQLRNTCIGSQFPEWNRLIAVECKPTHVNLSYLNLHKLINHCVTDSDMIRLYGAEVLHSLGSRRGLGNINRGENITTLLRQAGNSKESVTKIKELMQVYKERSDLGMSGVPVTMDAPVSYL